MLPTVPLSLCLFFSLTTALAVGLFYEAAGRSRRGLGLLLAVLLVQGALALGAFIATTLPQACRPGWAWRWGRRCSCCSAA